MARKTVLTQQQSALFQKILQHEAIAQAADNLPPTDEAQVFPWLPPRRRRPLDYSTRKTWHLSAAGSRSSSGRVSRGVGMND